MRKGGQVYFVRVDHIGRPMYATDTLGTKVWQVSYDPFGGVVASMGTPANIRFPGQWFQSKSGLHQNWMRDYDPTTGRYLQVDPLGLVDGASVYGYALQNPGRWVDPRGEQIAVPLGGGGWGKVGPLIGPKIGPLGGLLDLPPLIMPKLAEPDEYADHPIAKEEYREYKNFCGTPRRQQEIIVLTG